MAIIKCQNCGGELSDQSNICPHCLEPVPGAPRSVTLKQKSGNGILIPILSVLDGLILFGTAGIVAFGISTARIETSNPSAELATACRAISTMHRDANAAVLENVDVPLLEETAPVAMSEADESGSTEAAQSETNNLENVEQLVEKAEQKEQPTAQVQTASTNQTPLQALDSSSGESTVPLEALTSQSPKPDTGRDRESARDFSNGRVLITTASNNNNDPVYHTRDCVSARKIASKDEYWYASAADAEAAGRRLCGNCSR